MLDKAEVFRRAAADGQRKIPVLAGKTCVNLFFENSTRTRNSFSLAARRLGADTLDFSPSTSSLSKGETFIDTARNIEAMGIDLVVMRHRTPGAPHLLAQNLRCGVINAGDGAARAPDARPAGHDDDPPAQGPARRADGGPGGRHRPQPHRPVEHLGAQEARRKGDRLRPFDAGFAPLGRAGRRVFVQPGRNPAAGGRAEPVADPVRAADEPAVPLGAGIRPPVRDESAAAGQAKPDVLIIAPGPINRGVEITPEVADGPHSAILEQVTNGVAVRMAVTWLILGR